MDEKYLMEISSPSEDMPINVWDNIMDAVEKGMMTQAEAVECYEHYVTQSLSSDIDISI